MGLLFNNLKKCFLTFEFKVSNFLIFFLGT